jgi:hypothetical protein
MCSLLQVIVGPNESVNVTFHGTKEKAERRLGRNGASLRGKVDSFIFNL